MVQQHQEPKARIRTAAGVLGGSTALLLGVLYTLGAAVEARRLAIAHASIADVLPQVPLPQLLADGIGLLVGALVVVGLITLIAAGLLQLETRLEPYLEKRRRRQRTIRSQMAVTWGTIRALQAESKALTITAERAREVTANPPEIKTPTTPAERDSLIALKAELDQLTEDAQNYKPRLAALAAKAKEASREHDRFARRVRIGNLPFKLFARSLRWGPLCLALVGSLFVTLPLAVSFIAAGLVWRLRRHTEIRVLLVALYVIVVIGFVIDRIIYVSPLPKAQIDIGTSSLRGTLVLTTDATWYLAEPTKTVVAIPASRVVTATYTSAPGETRKTVVDLLAEACSQGI